MMAIEERESAIPLREYVDIMVRHERELRAEWIKMNAEMVREAKNYVDTKLEKMNEMREQINTERGQYALRIEHVADYKAIDGRLRVIEGFTANLQGRILVTASVLGFLVVLIAHFWR